MSVLEYKVEVGGLVGEFTRYGVRIHEAFIAMLLLSLYFAVALGRTGRAAGDDDRAKPRGQPDALIVRRASSIPCDRGVILAMCQ